MQACDKTQEAVNNYLIKNTKPKPKMEHHMGESADTINKEMVPQVGEMQEILEYRKTLNYYK